MPHKIEIVTEFSATNVPIATLGESPAVDDAAGRVWWVDTAGKRLYLTEFVGGATQYWDMPEEPGFVVLDKVGLPLIGMETGIFAFDPRNITLSKILDQKRYGHRFNDATVDENGSLWVSTIPLDLTKGQAAIWRVTTDMTLLPIKTGLCIPNGMSVDTERGRLYYSDSHWDIQAIWTAAINHNTGTVGDSALFADMKALPGRPDGAAIDCDGRYWIAAVDGAELNVYSPEGELLFEVALPFRCPTKPAFFGKNSGKLVVTSKSDGGQGGRLAFISFLREGVCGKPQARWKPAHFSAV